MNSLKIIFYELSGGRRDRSMAICLLRRGGFSDATRLEGDAASPHEFYESWPRYGASQYCPSN